MTDLKRLVDSLYELLKPVEPSDRKEAVDIVMRYFGEMPDVEADGEDQIDASNEPNKSNFHPKAHTWMRQNNVTINELAEVFHVENGEVQLIANVAPGSNGMEKTINAFLLTGLGQLLVNGEAKFDDQVGRNNCLSLGCFQKTNHATYMKGKGNNLSGSKLSGWTVTTPGLKMAAGLVKEISKK